MVRSDRDAHLLWARKVCDQSAAGVTRHHNTVRSSQPDIIEMVNSNIHGMTHASENESQERKRCRICLSSNGKLISPCKCKGTIAKVHKSCFEKWLGCQSSDRCELCRTQIPMEKVFPTLKEWTRVSSGKPRLFADFGIFLMLLGIGLGGVVHSIKAFVVENLTLCETISLSILMPLQFITILVWFAVIANHHQTTFRAWRARNYKVSISLKQIRAQRSQARIGTSMMAWPFNQLMESTV